MPRPRQFDDHDAVRKAIEVFRRQGYHGTSTRDLGAAMGLNPSSLYRAYGDKHALFLRALDSYQTVQDEATGEITSSSDSVRSALRRWLVHMITEEQDHAWGCLMVNTAAELGAEDSPTRERVHAAFDGNVTVIADLLQKAVAEGEITREIDVRGWSELLFTTVAGLRVRDRAGQPLERLTAAVDTALDAIWGR
ncbi:TetR/AcrR family transcriptional regulator [Lentzea sp. HUAS12]|uniref:TetR/AcrR family transcriptional regulator n=1 Tax=Lentzea sp. HUAS12 TaxID=2951806 RepID=UPI00209E29A9|nr:TetR/AcrR family transcriptional regulator [Lentzea sp. HUAS12]USX49418.1 TetR/AcrR family transcriptional regulator [Lentzea sp. HUAS12]